MERLRDTVGNSTKKRQEVVGIHANAMIERNIADAREVNKRMDALCINETIAKKVLGDEIYQEMKPQLQSTKQFLDTKNSKEVMELPEFKIFIEQYILEKTKKQQKKVSSQTIESIEDIFNKTPQPEDIQKAKDQENILNTTKNNLNNIIKKYGGERLFDVLRKSIITESQTNQIYSFMFEYMESPTSKKKYVQGQAISDFYKKSEIDYRCNDENKKKINKEIDKRVIKLKEKIKKWEDKEKKIIEKKIKKESIGQEKRDYTQEALSIFLNQIPNNTAIKERFYLPEDKEDIEQIQSYFIKHLGETIPSPDKEDLIKDYNTPLHTIERSENKIKMNPNDYIEIERRKIEYKNRFTTGERNPREYLFDRLIEYAGKDILEYKINSLIKKNSKYKGTTCSIEKTDGLDDTSAGADYIVTYTIPGKQKKRIAAVDLFISEKDGGKNEEENEDKRKQKKESAKTGRIPYSTYIHTFANTQENRYIMEPLKRYVEQQDPMLVYGIMAQAFRNRKTDITHLLEGFDKRGMLYNKIEEITKNMKETTKNIEEQLHQNIFLELEKIAA